MEVSSLYRQFNEGMVSLMKAQFHALSELIQCALPDHKLQGNFVLIFFIRGHWAIGYLHLLGKIDRGLVIKILSTDISPSLFTLQTQK